MLQNGVWKFSGSRAIPFRRKPLEPNRVVSTYSVRNGAESQISPRLKLRCPLTSINGTVRVAILFSDQLSFLLPIYVLKLRRYRYAKQIYTIAGKWDRNRKCVVLNKYRK